MRKPLFILFALPIFSFSQTAAPLSKDELKNVYVQSIGDFIKESNKKNNVKFDTLWFGNRKYGQPDDFPDIELPSKMENTVIRLISPEEGMKKQNEKRSRNYINLISWTDKSKADFLFFVFTNGFEQRYNYTMNYTFNSGTKKFELIKIQRKDPPFK